MSDVIGECGPEYNSELFGILFEDDWSSGVGVPGRGVGSTLERWVGVPGRGGLEYLGEVG